MSRNIIRRGALLAVLLLPLALAGSPATGQSDRAAARTLGYHPVGLQPDGKVDPASLEALVQSIRPAATASNAQIVLMVHGFNTSGTRKRREYRQIAADLQRGARGLPITIVPVGVDWQSYPGAALEWVPRAVGYHFTSLLGFKKALRNPYDAKLAVAREAGALGMRDMLLRLRQEFPDTATHALAHSLGSEIVVRALAHEPAEEEEPQLGLVALAGAALDHDAFTRQAKHSLRPALERGSAWWITVPEAGRADAALEFLRGSLRKDAVGNVGLTLERADFARLMQRGGILFDNSHIPIHHDHVAYYTRGRLRRLVLTLDQLRQLPAATPQATPHLVERLLSAPPARPPTRILDRVTIRLYDRWRTHREDPLFRDYGVVKLEEPTGSR